MTSFADLVAQDSARAWLFIPSAIVLAPCMGSSAVTRRRAANGQPARILVYRPVP